VPEAAPKWAKELRKGLLAEIEAIEAGARKTFEIDGRSMTDVSAEALKRLKLRLKQVQQLIATFEA
jgi:hypothetical protein